MKIKKYISREVLIKLGFFLLIAGAAMVFDYFHQGKGSAVPAHDTREQQAAGSVMTCYCGPLFTVSLKAPVQEVPQGKATRERLNRLIREHLVARSFYLSRAEVLQQPLPCLSLRNLISHRCRIVTDPGDHPALF